MKVLIISFLFLLPVMKAGAQTEAIDLVNILSVDIERKGGENVLFKNGEKLDKSQARLLFALSPDALESLNRAYRNRAAGHAFAYVGGFVFGFGIGMAIGGEKVGTSLGVSAVGGGIIAAGIPFIRAYNRHSAAAVGVYNESVFRSVVPQKSLELSFGPTQSGGLGLTLLF